MLERRLEDLDSFHPETILHAHSLWILSMYPNRSNLFDLVKCSRVREPDKNSIATDHDIHFLLSHPTNESWEDNIISAHIICAAFEQQ